MRCRIYRCVHANICCAYSIEKTVLSEEVCNIIYESKKYTGDFMKKVLLATWALRDRYIVVIEEFTLKVPFLWNQLYYIMMWVIQWVPGVCILLFVDFLNLCWSLDNVPPSSIRIIHIQRIIPKNQVFALTNRGIVPI